MFPQAIITTVTYFKTKFRTAVIQKQKPNKHEISGENAPIQWGKKNQMLDVSVCKLNT